MYNRIIFNSFVNNPIRYPIEGTKESISNINKEILYDAYNTFYHPSNMFLIVVGNVKVEDVIDLVKKNQENKTFLKPYNIKTKLIKEPDEVYKPLDIIEADVIIPKAAISYKLNIRDMDFEKIYQYLLIFLSIKLGPTSKLNNELRNEGLISNAIDYDIVYTDTHILYFISIESYEPEKVLDRIKQEMNDRNILEPTFLRKKKVLKSSKVFRSDDIFAISSKINQDLIQYGKIRTDIIPYIDSLNYNEFQKLLNQLDFNNTAQVILKNHLHSNK